jgi:hypothetical protein
MAITKPQFYLTISGLLLIGIISMTLFGSQLQTLEHVSLDNDSSTYINTFNTLADERDITEDYATTLAQENNKTNPLLESIKGISALSSFFGVISVAIDVLDGIWDMLTFLWDIPSFLVSTLGFPTEDWKHVYNVLGYLISVSIIIVILREAK